MFRVTVASLLGTTRGNVCGWENHFFESVYPLEQFPRISAFIGASPQMPRRLPCIKAKNCTTHNKSRCFESLSHHCSGQLGTLKRAMVCWGSVFSLHSCETDQ